MTVLQDAVAGLKEVLETIPDLVVYLDPGASVQGLGAVITPPILSWESFCEDPTEATFVVHLVVPFDEYATFRLYELLEPVVTAIQSDPRFSVSSASPGLLQSGGAQLPTYAISVDTAL
ncbi:hypothetical protein [Amycolatopsis sp. NPDC051903]|uniref:hypothetical protein n=1 Tax=Amycolatopsis sp. NPDC051903 TaxID=3363936 RepID=UPI003798B1E3